MALDKSESRTSCVAVKDFQFNELNGRLAGLRVIKAGDHLKGNEGLLATNYRFYKSVGAIVDFGVKGVVSGQGYKRYN